MAAFFISCVPADWYTFEHDIQGASVKEFNRWILENIKYVSDKQAWDTEDYWQTPEQTYEFLQGDCEDKAILLMYLLWENGTASDLLIVTSEAGNHALVQVKNTWYEPGIGKTSKRYEVRRVIAYEDAIEMAQIHRGTL